MTPEQRERIESCDYGLCIACEEEIALRRQETDPVAVFCIDRARRARATMEMPA